MGFVYIDAYLNVMGGFNDFLFLSSGFRFVYKFYPSVGGQKLHWYTVGSSVAKMKKTRTQKRKLLFFNNMEC